MRMSLRYLFASALTAALVLPMSPVHAAQGKIAGWRDYRLGMSSKEFGTVYPANCAPSTPASAALLQITDAEKDKVVGHLPPSFPEPSNCEATVAIRELGAYQYRVSGAFSNDRLVLLTIRIEVGSSIGNDPRRRIDVVRSQLSKAAQRYGAPDLMQADSSGWLAADWKFEDASSLHIALTDASLSPGLISIHSAKFTQLFNDYQ